MKSGNGPFEAEFPRVPKNTFLTPERYNEHPCVWESLSLLRCQEVVFLLSFSEYYFPFVSEGI